MMELMKRKIGELLNNPNIPDKTSSNALLNSKTGQNQKRQINEFLE